MCLVSSHSCFYPIQWSHVLSREWRCSWSSTGRRCYNYIWYYNLIAYKGATYIGGLNGTCPVIKPLLYDILLATWHMKYNDLINLHSYQRTLLNTLRPRKSHHFFRRFFQIHFLGWKCLNFNKNCCKIPSLEFDWLLISQHNIIICCPYLMHMIKKSFHCCS